MRKYWNSWWKPLPPRPKDTPPKSVKPVKPMEPKEKKFAVVVGHTKLKRGACSPYGIPCEWEFNKKVASYLEDVADIYFYDSYNYGYKSMVKRNAAKMNKKDYDLVIELHYNAGVSLANGTEAFYYVSNSKGKKLAKEYCKEYCKAFGTKNRGAKAFYSSAQRGFWAVALPKATTLLLEPFFGSNMKDAATIKNKEKDYAKLIKKVLFK